MHNVIRKGFLLGFGLYGGWYVAKGLDAGLCAGLDNFRKLRKETHNKSDENDKANTTENEAN